MLSQPRACSRAVQRRIQKPTESIWVSDDTLTRLFENFFLISTRTKRHGSFVPGPLESRRRLDKRKLTLMSETSYAQAPQPLPNFGALWGLPGNPDVGQWQWQAPKSRVLPVAKGGKSLLPKWLEEFVQAPWEEEETGLDDERTLIVESENSHTIDLIMQFRDAMRTVGVEEAIELCHALNKNLEMKLALGLVPEDILSPNIKRISGYIRQTIEDETCQTSLLLAFYQAVWNGIQASRVIEPSELEGKTLQRLMSQLSKLPSSIESRALIAEVLRSSTSQQAAEFKRPLLEIKDAVIKSMKTSFTGALTTDSIEHPPLEKDMYSVVQLVESLEPLSGTGYREILRNMTDYIVLTLLERYSDNISIMRKTRQKWLLMITKLTCLDQKLLGELWMKMDHRSGDRTLPPMTFEQSCQIVESWLCKESLPVASSAEAALSQLYNSLELQRRPTRARTSVLRLFHDLGQPEAARMVFIQLARGKITVSWEVVRMELERMCHLDPKAVLKLFKSNGQSDTSDRQLQLYRHPNVVIMMIEQGILHPHDIWAGLNVPIQPSVGPLANADTVGRPSDSLVEAMAVAFAQNKKRSPRVMLRNVTYCAMYLRDRGVKVSPQLARAFSLVGLQRDILEKGRLGRSKARWVLNIIERGEGSQVAQKSHEMIESWRHSSKR